MTTQRPGKRHGDWVPLLTACPECGNRDGLLNVGSIPYGICNAHRTAWIAVPAERRSRRGEGFAEWFANRERLQAYEMVTPLQKDGPEKRPGNWLHWDSQPGHGAVPEVISSYTRAEAVADGLLIDVTGIAKEAGITYPTALTTAVWSQCVAVPEMQPWQDEPGRLWDVVWMLRHALGRSTNGIELPFAVYLQNDKFGPQPVRLKAVCGPGDQGEPVITVLFPNED